MLSRLAAAAALLLCSVAPPALAQQEPGSAGYDRGIYVLSEDGNYLLRTNLRLQTRYAFDEELSSLFVRRARLKFSGHAHDPALVYYFQFDFGRGHADLIDANLNYTLIPEVEVRVGSFKMPFSRQQITSSERLMLTERAITDRYFGAGRDIGAMLHNGLSSSDTVEWAVGVFSGNGISNDLHGSVHVNPETGEGVIDDGDLTNVTTFERPTLAARVGYNSTGSWGYAEGDVTGRGPRVSVGSSLLWDHGQTPIGEVDAMVKLWGLSVLTGVFYRMETDEVASALGGMVQLDYLWQQRVGPALRFSRIESDTGNLQEVAAGLNVLFHAHRIKWQTDVSLLSNNVNREVEDQMLIHSQFQFAF